MLHYISISYLSFNRGEDFLEINQSETSSLKSAHFVMIHYQTWPPQAILVSDWPIFKKSSPLKPLGQMNQDLVRSIYGRFSIKIAHFVP
jgi:hypothetical protein